MGNLRDIRNGVIAAVIAGVLLSGGVITYVISRATGHFTVRVWVAVLLGCVLVGGSLGVGVVLRPPLRRKVKGPPLMIGPTGLQPASRDLTRATRVLARDAQVNRIYAAHLIQIIATIQALCEGRLGGIGRTDFVERGILLPAQETFHKAGKTVNISVLVPAPDSPSDFVMEFAAGHSVQGVQKFRRPIADTFAGVAYRTREPKLFNDVDREQTFVPNPDAQPGRGIESMVAVPLVVHDSVYGVLSTVSYVKNTFSVADTLYLSAVGAALSLALGLDVWTA